MKEITKRQFRMTIYVAVLVVCITPVSANDGRWKFESEIDAISDEEIRTAFITNQQNSKVSIYTMEGRDGIWLGLSLGKNSNTTIDSDRAPILRIDDYDPHDLDITRAAEDVLQKYGKRNESRYEWNPSFINVEVAANKDSSDFVRILYELMNGQELLVRYFVGTGGAKDIYFELGGARTAILKVLDINDEVDWESQWNRLVIAENKAQLRKDCRKKLGGSGVKARECIDALRECSDIDELDALSISRCLENVRGRYFN